MMSHTPVYANLHAKQCPHFAEQRGAVGDREGNGLEEVQNMWSV